MRVCEIVSVNTAIVNGAIYADFLLPVRFWKDKAGTFYDQKRRRSPKDQRFASVQELDQNRCSCAGAGAVVHGGVSSGSLAHEASTIAIIENTEKRMMDFFIARIVVDLMGVR
jgi:hypothetical protein